MRAASTSPWTTSTALSRRVPVLCKVAPAKADVHMEDVHRAGGIMAILGELDRAGLINRELPTVHAATLGDALDRWDIAPHQQRRRCATSSRAAPGGVPTQVAFSQDRRWDELDLDRETGVIRDAEHAVLARMAASPCSTATSRSTAAS